MSDAETLLSLAVGKCTYARRVSEELEEKMKYCQLLLFVRNRSTGTRESRLWP